LTIRPTFFGRIWQTSRWVAPLLFRPFHCEFIIKNSVRPTKWLSIQKVINENVSRRLHQNFVSSLIETKKSRHWSFLRECDKVFGTQFVALLNFEPTNCSSFVFWPPN
jgi:hypothetical protein